MKKKLQSKDSLDDYDDDFTISSESDRENETVKNHENEFLNQLNRDLQEQLKLQSHIGNFNIKNHNLLVSFLSLFKFRYRRSKKCS